jgi:hypothetical protein
MPPAESLMELASPKYLGVEFHYVCRCTHELYETSRHQIPLGDDGKMPEFELVQLIDRQRRRGDRIKEILLYNSFTGDSTPLTAVSRSSSSSSSKSTSSTSSATTFSLASIQMPKTLGCYHDLHTLWIFVYRNDPASMPAGAPTTTSTGYSKNNNHHPPHHHASTLRAKHVRKLVLSKTLRNLAAANANSF